MQASYSGPLASYNSLEDEHLAEYFSNPIRVQHLRKMGLITRDGRIVSEGTVRRNAARKEHKARTEDLLADTIVQNALELERKRRAVLKKKLEQLAKIQIAERVKSQKSHPTGVQEFNPQTLHHPFHRLPAPPPRLSATLDSHSDKLGLSGDQLYEMRKLVTDITKDKSVRIRAKSPYKPGQWSRSSTPAPLAPRPPSAPKPHSSMPSQSRRLQLTHQNSRPKTAPVTGQRPLIPRRSLPIRSEVRITLRYIGKNLHLESSYTSNASEVLILQQHCGGNTVQLYKGRVRPREQFTFESRRHLRMPFGLSIYLDGMMDSRVSACCEYKHQCGRLLGSKSAHFRLIRVEGGRPCAKCNAESERKERKEKMQKSLDEVINATPSTEIDEELGQLLARNGIVASPTQEDIEMHEPVNTYTPKPEDTTKDTTEDKEVQDTDDLYEDDFAKTTSEVSLDSHHSSGSERAESLTREPESGVSSRSHSRSSSASSVSSLSSEESTPDLERSSRPPSESGSVPPAGRDSVTSQTAPISESNNDLDTKYEDDAFEEPDDKEEHEEQPEPAGGEELGEQPECAVEEHEERAVEGELPENAIPESASQRLDSKEQQAGRQLSDPEQSDSQDEAKNSQLTDKVVSAISPNESTEHGGSTQLQDDSPIEAIEHLDNEANRETLISSEAVQTKSPEHPVAKSSTEVTVESTKLLSTDNETHTATNTQISSPSFNLSSSITLKEATKALEKSLSAATSLSSLLNDGGSRIPSSVDLSDHDEDIPQLEKKIHALSIPSLEASTDPAQASDTAIDEPATSQHASNSLIESSSTAHTSDHESNVELPKAEDEPEANHTPEVTQANLTSDTAAASEEPLAEGEPISSTSIRDDNEPGSNNEENASSVVSLSSSLTSVSSQHTQSSS